MECKNKSMRFIGSVFGLCASIDLLKNIYGGNATLKEVIEKQENEKNANMRRLWESYL
jgi:hypothetical protein